MPGGCFSKTEPVAYRARKEILETVIRLPRKVAFLICFRYRKRQNNCHVSEFETCCYYRYKGICVTRKVLGLSRNRPDAGCPRLCIQGQFIASLGKEKVSFERKVCLVENLVSIGFLVDGKEEEGWNQKPEDRKRTVS